MTPERGAPDGSLKAYLLDRNERITGLWSELFADETRFLIEENALRIPLCCR